MAKTIGFVIMAGHLDIEWYQPLRSYRFWTASTLDKLRERAKGGFPPYTLDGQTFPLEEYLEIAPEAEGDMRRLIAEGRLAVGPFYTQFDEWLPSAESMIRNCMAGDRMARAYGRRMRAGYLPDNFGHPRQLPQILNNFGIDSLLFMRGMPEVEGGHPDEFLYEGIDGSRVLASHFRDGYGGAFDLNAARAEPLTHRDTPYSSDYISFEHHSELAELDDPERVARSMLANVRRLAERYPSGVVPLVAGGDHMPPQTGLDEAIRIANGLCDDVEFACGTAEGYIETMRARVSRPEVFSMELIGSRYHAVLLGALSTRTYLKRLNFGCEALIEKYAEPLEAIARMMGYAPRAAYLREAWRNLLINSAHDSIHGSSVDEVQGEMEARFLAARQNATGVAHEALAYIGARTARREGARTVLGFAPAKCSFPQMAEVWLPVGDGPVGVRDGRGDPVPTQTLPRETTETNGIGLVRNDMYPAESMRRVLYLANYRPGAIERFEARAEQSPIRAFAAADNWLDNEFLHVDVEGALIHVTDKASGKRFSGLNLLVEEADAGDAWDFSPPWTPGEAVLSDSCAFRSRLIECGAVRATIEIEGEMSVPARLEGDRRSARRVGMPVRFRVSVLRGVPRVDVKLYVDNTAEDHRLRLRVPMGVVTKRVLSQGHLAILDREIERPAEVEQWRQPPSRLMPCREWIAACDGERGLAVAFKGLYDYEAESDPLTRMPNVSLTLLRGVARMGRIHTAQRDVSASMAIPTPGAQCKGPQEIEWSYIPFEADPADVAPFLPLAQAFLYPPLTHAVRSLPTADSHGAADAPFAWDAANIAFSAFKRAEEGEGFILRVYENQGKDTEFPLRTRGFSRAWIANMNEEISSQTPMTDGVLWLHAAPWKALTLRLE